MNQVDNKRKKSVGDILSSIVFGLVWLVLVWTFAYKGEGFSVLLQYFTDNNFGQDIGLFFTIIIWVLWYLVHCFLIFHPGVISRGFSAFFSFITAIFLGITCLWPAVRSLWFNSNEYLSFAFWTLIVFGAYSLFVAVRIFVMLYRSEPGPEYEDESAVTLAYPSEQ